MLRQCSAIAQIKLSAASCCDPRAAIPNCVSHGRPPHWATLTFTYPSFGIVRDAPTKAHRQTAKGAGRDCHPVIDRHPADQMYCPRYFGARRANHRRCPPEVVPDFFRLTLETTDEVLSPKCSVRWRTGNEIGVEFLGYGCLHSPPLSTTMSTSRPRRSRER